MDEDQKKKLNEAHKWSRRAHDYLYGKPDGSPPDHPTIAEWIFREYQRTMRKGWATRLLLVQLPVTLGALGVLYGAGVGIYEAIIWLMERMK